MSRSFGICGCVVSLLCMFAAGQERQAPAAISSVAEEYINQVLELMQGHALHASEIDWASVRTETMRRAAGAQTTADTYPAIFYAITQLKERHSFLRIPDSLPDADKKRAYASMSAILGPYKKQSSRLSSPVFVGRSVQSAHLINAGDAIFAYVVIPACGAKRTNVQENAVDFRAYADSLHSIAAGLEASHPWGWIVDLRGNRGGNMYPMIAGIGFVLGEGPLGYFVSSNGVEDDWFYRQGSAGTMVGSRESTMAQVRDAPLSISDLPPVAVLLDSGTASAGEAVAISFIGRPRTRSFGSHTFGLSTGNKGFPLSDGALLVLCEVTEADRNQRRYPDGIEPDVVLPELATLPSEEADPVIQAAKQWLFSLRTQ